MSNNTSFTILVGIFILSTSACLYKVSERQSNYRLRKLQDDSLKIVIHNYRQDTLAYKVHTDFAFRARINAVSKLTDQEIIQLINKRK